MNQLPETGFLRLSQIIGRAAVPGDAAANPPKKAKPAIPALIPVSKSKIWDDIKKGRFPKPVKLGPRVAAWRVEDIRALIEQNGRQAAA